MQKSKLPFLIDKKSKEYKELMEIRSTLLKAQKMLEEAANKIKTKDAYEQHNDGLIIRR